MYRKHIKILSRLEESGTVDIWDAENNPDGDIMLELYEAGFITCSNGHQLHGTPDDAYVNLSITMAGRDQLSAWIQDGKEKTIPGKLKKGFFFILTHSITVLITVFVTVYVTKILSSKEDSSKEQSPIQELHDKEATGDNSEK